MSTQRPTEQQVKASAALLCGLPAPAAKVLLAGLTTDERDQVLAAMRDQGAPAAHVAALEQE